MFLQQSEVKRLTVCKQFILWTRIVHVHVQEVFTFSLALNAGILETADNQVYINSVIPYQSYGIWKSTP